MSSNTYSSVHKESSRGWLSPEATALMVECCFLHMVLTMVCITNPSVQIQLHLNLTLQQRAQMWELLSSHGCSGSRWDRPIIRRHVADGVIYHQQTLLNEQRKRPTCCTAFCDNAAAASAPVVAAALV